MNNEPIHRVLLIDDEPDILELLQYNLLKEGYEVRTASDGRKGIEIAKEFLPNLILVDIMMPGMDGVETGRRLRALPEMDSTFLIFLTARSEEYSEVAAFDIGADDYITKPIKPRALISRIGALFKREFKKEPETGNLSMDGLVIDKNSYTVLVWDKPVNLPKKEFELLFFLAQNSNKVFSREELLGNIWGTGVYVLARTVDVHVRKVREKIGDSYIKTIKGVGYKFNAII